MVDGAALPALLNRYPDQSALLFGLLGSNDSAEHPLFTPDSMVEIPADVFASDPHSHRFTIELMELLQMVIDDLTDGRVIRLWLMVAGSQKVFNLTKEPGTPLSASSNHDRIGSGLLQYITRFSRAVDVTIGDHRNGDCRFNHGDGLIFRLA